MLKFIFKIPGGYSEKVESTMEIYGPSGFQMGPDIAVQVRYHCMDVINQTHGIIVGGTNHENV